MDNKISIIINGVQYDRVPPPLIELSCDGCDLEHLCSDIESHFPMLCYAISEMDSMTHVFKKAEK